MYDLDSLRADAHSVRADIERKEELLKAAEEREDHGHARTLRTEIEGAQHRLADYEDDIAKVERES